MPNHKILSEASNMGTVTRDIETIDPGLVGQNRNFQTKSRNPDAIVFPS